MSLTAASYESASSARSRSSWCSHAGALLFAVGFIVLSIIYTVVNVLVAGDDVAFRRQAIRTMAVTLVPVSVALIAGAVVGGFAQIVLWLAAVVAEGITVYLTSRDGHWQLPSAAHYAERHSLVVILALGESIISIGLGAEHSALTVGVISGCVLAVFVALGMWWNYFDRLSAAGERAIQALSGTRRTSVATAGTYLHFGIVAGILLTSLGLGDAIEHIAGGEHLGFFGAASMSSGLALFLLSTSIYARVVSGRNLPGRAVVAALAIALAPLLAVAPALVSITIMLVLPVAVAAIERGAERRPRTTAG
jgi:low temperature requirement protein LtrA